MRQRRRLCPGVPETGQRLQRQASAPDTVPALRRWNGASGDGADPATPPRRSNAEPASAEMKRCKERYASAGNISPALQRRASVPGDGASPETTLRRSGDRLASGTPERCPRRCASAGTLSRRSSTVAVFREMKRWKRRQAVVPGLYGSLTIDGIARGPVAGPAPLACLWCAFAAAQLRPPGLSPSGSGARRLNWGK